MSEADVAPSWYTPHRLLALFCAMQFLVYCDRGVRTITAVACRAPTPLHAAPTRAQVIASTGVKGAPAAGGAAGTGYDGEFNLSTVQDGALYSAFMARAPPHPSCALRRGCGSMRGGARALGPHEGGPAVRLASFRGGFEALQPLPHHRLRPFRVARPPHPQTVGRANQHTLTSILRSVFGRGRILTTAGCAVSPNFGVFLICRMAVGLGEASFCSLGAPFIDDAAPPGRKTRWLAIFFMMIPVGVGAPRAPAGSSLTLPWALAQATGSPQLVGSSLERLWGSLPVGGHPLRCCPLPWSPTPPF